MIDPIVFGQAVRIGQNRVYLNDQVIGVTNGESAALVFEDALRAANQQAANQQAYRLAEMIAAGNMITIDESEYFRQTGRLFESQTDAVSWTLQRERSTRPTLAQLTAPTRYVRGNPEPVKWRRVTGLGACLHDSVVDRLDVANHAPNLCDTQIPTLMFQEYVDEDWHCRHCSHVWHGLECEENVYAAGPIAQLAPCPCKSAFDG